MKIVFFGTPQFAANILTFLKEKNINVVAIVTQKDTPKGNSFIEPPVKKKALELFQKPPIFQPVKASDPEFIEEIKKLKPDLFIVVAYGQILKKALLDIPSKGCINIHASLLPKYRGAAPIQRAILNGEKTTGITIMKMVPQMDAGDIIALKEIEIGEMNFKELEENLCAIAKPLLFDVISAYEKNQIKAYPQDEKLVTYAPKITLSDLEINFNNDALNIYNQVRAFSPIPGARCLIELHGEKKMMKILQCKVLDVKNSLDAPGKVLKFEKDVFIIACKNQALQILKLQIEGKKAMDSIEFIRGVKNSIKIVFP